MSSLLEVIEFFFYLSIVVAIAASLLAMLVASIDALVGRWLTPRIKCLLWTLVIVRFLIPVVPASSYGLIPDKAPWVSEKPTRVLEHKVMLESTISSVALRAVGEFLEVLPSTKEVGPSWINILPKKQTTLLTSLSLLWFLGAVLLICRTAIATIQFTRRIARSSDTTNKNITNVLNKACEALSVRRKPDLKFIEGLQTPAIFGVLKPTICLPIDCEKGLSNQQLRMIFLHELAHLNRRDLLRKWCVVFSKIVHWYNPLVWYAASRVVENAEHACDLSVKKIIEPADRKGYLDLLLSFASASDTTRNSKTVVFGLMPLTVQFARRGVDLKHRMQVFSEDKSTRRMPRILVVAIMILVAWVGFTKASQKELKSLHPYATSGLELTIPHYTSRQFRDVAVNKEAAERFLHEYNISEALKNLAEFYPKREPIESLKLSLYPQFPGSKSIRKTVEDSIVECDVETGKIILQMTEAGHHGFAEMLEGLTLSGPWQVVVRMQRFKVFDLELLKEIDWDHSFHFTLPKEHDSFEKTPQFYDPQKAWVKVDSKTSQYTPHVIDAMTKDEKNTLMERLDQHYGNSSINFPSVTCFNGQSISMMDTCETPFVCGVDRIEGELGFGYQPLIGVFEEGLRIQLRTLVLDVETNETIELNCHITQSEIGDVDTVKLPGQNVTIQTPSTSKKEIQFKCNLNSNECLFVAPTFDDLVDDEHPLEFLLIELERIPGKKD